MNATRSSVYLDEKAASLIQALTFFLSPSQNGLERHLTFLAQIDFWDWEVESLVFAFENFETRSRAWNSVQGLLNGIAKNNLTVKLGAKQESQLRVQKNPYIRRGRFGKTVVVAPSDALIEVLETWHRVLDEVEHFVRVPQKHIDTFGLVGEKDLSKFRKKIPGAFEYTEEGTQEEVSPTDASA